MGLDVPWRVKCNSTRSSNATPRYVSKRNLSTHTFVQGFTAEWLIIARMWKQPRCPSLMGGVAMQWVSLSHKNKTHTTIGLNLKNIMLGARSQTQKAHMIGPHWQAAPRTGEPREAASRFVVARGRGAACQWAPAFFLVWRYVLKVITGNTAQLWIC